MSDAVSKKFVENKVKWFQTKVGSIEKRAMDNNMLGHEAVRMVLNAVFSYLEDGDPMWLLRSLRTFFKTTKIKDIIKTQKTNRKNEDHCLAVYEVLGLGQPDDGGY